MTIILYSPITHEEGIYEAAKAKYMSMGYKVYNPYNGVRSLAEIRSKVIDCVGQYNVIVVLDGKVDEEVRRAVRRSFVIFRNDDGGI